MATAAENYYDSTLTLLHRLKETQLGNIEKAAELCADRISKGGLIFLFGSGHSRMMTEEMTPRQGCFVGFVALVEHSLSNHAEIVGSNGLRAPLHLEKFDGYAEEILKSFKFGPNDAFIIISTSGIRPVIVESALGVKERGMPVIAIVSRSHCESSTPAHSSSRLPRRNTRAPLEVASRAADSAIPDDPVMRRHCAGLIIDRITHRDA